MNVILKHPERKLSSCKYMITPAMFLECSSQNHPANENIFILTCRKQNPSEKVC